MVSDGSRAMANRGERESNALDDGDWWVMVSQQWLIVVKDGLLWLVLVKTYSSKCCLAIAS